MEYDQEPHQQLDAGSAEGIAKPPQIENTVCQAWGAIALGPDAIAVGDKSVEDGSAASEAKEMLTSIQQDQLTQLLMGVDDPGKRQEITIRFGRRMARKNAYIRSRTGRLIANLSQNAAEAGQKKALSRFQKKGIEGFHHVKSAEISAAKIRGTKK